MIYVIEKGKHRSGIFPFGLTFATKLTRKVKFRPSCNYDLNSADQGDINKLFGLSDKWSHHHKNSARFGWKYNIFTHKIEICSYVYRDGKRYIEYITHVSLGQENTFTLEIGYGVYKFTVNNITSVISRNTGLNDSSKFSLRYKLYPYFGGNRTAPHKMEISMKKPFINKISRFLCLLSN